MALTKITSTNIGANAVTSALIANVSSATITSGLGYTPINKAGDSMTGGGSLDFVSSSNRAIVGVRGTGFGYDPTSYEVLQVGRGTLNESVAIAVDPSAVTGGSFTGNGKEVCFPNGVSFITPNSGGTDWIAPMRFDSAGRITKPTQPRFQAGDNALGTITSGGYLIFDSYIYNPTSNYNTTNGRFTAPIAGFYQFNYCIRFDGVPSGIGYIRVQPILNGNHIEYYAGDAIFGSNMASANYLHSAMSFCINMAAGDYISLQYGSGGGYSCSCYGGFSGYLVA